MATRPIPEPSARFYHAAVGAGQNMLLWAGDGGNGSAVPSSVVERFNVLTIAWQEPRQFDCQSFPSDLQRMAVTSDGEKAYFFGGWVGPGGCESRNKLYALDLSSLLCEEVVPAEECPNPRANSGMVHYRRKLVLYGGYTQGPSDDLFVFDLDNSEL